MCIEAQDQVAYDLKRNINHLCLLAARSAVKDCRQCEQPTRLWCAFRASRQPRSPAYRSAANESFMAKNSLVDRIHRKKPKGRPMPDAVRRANALKSAVCSRVEHLFAEQKDRMELFIRTIGIARANVE